MLKTKRKEVKEFEGLVDLLPTISLRKKLSFLIIIGILIILPISYKAFINYRLSKLPTPEALYEKALEMYRFNSYYIEAEVFTTREDQNYKKRKEYLVKTYIDDNVWHSTKQYKFEEENYHIENVTFYDGDYLYSYGDNINENNPQYEVYYSDGSRELNRLQKYDRNLTLMQAINYHIGGNILFRWYESNAGSFEPDWNFNEKPIVVGKKRMNGYPCIYIKFSENREACINEDYGVAVYHKQQGVAPANKSKVIDEINIIKLKNTERDNFKMDYSLLKTSFNMDLRPYQEFIEESE